MSHEDLIEEIKNLEVENTKLRDLLEEKNTANAKLTVANKALRDAAQRMGETVQVLAAALAQSPVEPASALAAVNYLSEALNAAQGKLSRYEALVAAAGAMKRAAAQGAAGGVVQGGGDAARASEG